MRKLSEALFFLLWLLEGTRSDPCKAYSELPRAEYRGGQCQNVLGKEVCDIGLTFNWYRAIGLNRKDLEIQTTPARLRTCGTKFPIWMNGTHPTIADGEVTRTACLVDNTDCDFPTSTKVKNCSGYYVYQLRKTDACSEGYCFGKADPCPPFDPCDVFGFKTIDYDESRSAVCSSLSGLCDNLDKTSWYRFEGLLNLTTSCPTKSNACGSQTAMWINDTNSLPNGSDEHTVCLKTSGNSCKSSFKMLSKQCSGFRVYDLGNKKTPSCSRYCTDDPTAVCSTLTPLTTKGSQIHSNSTGMYERVSKHFQSCTERTRNALPNDNILEFFKLERVADDETGDDKDEIMSCTMKHRKYWDKGENSGYLYRSDGTTSSHRCSLTLFLSLAVILCLRSV